MDELLAHGQASGAQWSWMDGRGVDCASDAAECARADCELGCPIDSVFSIAAVFRRAFVSTCASTCVRLLHCVLGSI